MFPFGMVAGILALRPSTVVQLHTVAEFGRGVEELSAFHQLSASVGKALTFPPMGNLLSNLFPRVAFQRGVSHIINTFRISAQVALRSERHTHTHGVVPRRIVQQQPGHTNIRLIL